VRAELTVGCSAAGSAKIIKTSMPSSAAATMPGHVRFLVASSDFISDAIEFLHRCWGWCYTLRMTLLEDVVADLFMRSEDEQDRAARALQTFLDGPEKLVT